MDQEWLRANDEPPWTAQRMGQEQHVGVALEVMGIPLLCSGMRYQDKLVLALKLGSSCPKMDHGTYGTSNLG
jgi:hypothetical protein